MSTFLVDQSKAHGYEILRCARCSRDFKAQVVTSVDASKSPQARTAILQWPLDRRCICKADITTGLACCGKPIAFDERTMLSPRGRGIECPRCGKTIAHIVCG